MNISQKSLVYYALGFDSDWVMRWRLLLAEYKTEIVHIAGITNTVVDAIFRLDIDPTCHISENLFKGLNENDYICVKHVQILEYSISSFKIVLTLVPV